MAIEIDEEGFTVESEEPEYDHFDDSAVYDIRIKVFGIGGGGGNAVENMAKKGLRSGESDDVNIEFIAVNTDVAALKKKDKTIMRRVQIGSKCAKGRGAGGKPEIGAQAAEENREEIQKELKGASLVFISATMGGGTGTGAAPIVASIAQDMGILTVGVVTKPFNYEGMPKMNKAMKGIDELRKHVDALVIIPNQKLMTLNEKGLTYEAAFRMVDDVLYRSVRIISEIINTTGQMNVDFADLSSTIKDAGDAHIAIGSGTGDKKVDDAVAEVVSSPLLETSIQNAGKLLVYVNLSRDVTMIDVDDAISKITKACDPSAEIITGANFFDDESVKDTITISVIATSFKDSFTSVAAETESVAEKIINDTAAVSKPKNDFASYLKDSKSGSGSSDDAYSELESLFKSRG